MFDLQHGKCACEVNYTAVFMFVFVPFIMFDGLISSDGQIL
jgi:hypothetical protein